MNHLSATAYNDLMDELANRYDAVCHYMKSRPPKDKYDGTGRGGAYWSNPDDIRLLNSSKMQRQRAVADMKVILAQISAIT